MKPYLVEESTYEVMPSHAERIVAYVTSQLENEVTESDLTVAILFVMLMESGFTPVDPEAENLEPEPLYGHEFNLKRLRNTKTLPDDWRRNDGASYQMQFRLEPFSSYTCTFLSINTENNMVDNLIVNLLVPQLESNGRCICIHPSKYILKNNPYIPAKFQNLKHLSMTFKNAVCQPVRCEILRVNNMLNGSLLGIPDEVKLNIFRFLSVKDIGAVARTNKDLHAFAGDQRLWKCYVERDFGRESLRMDVSSHETVNWKREYKNRYAIQLKMWKERETLRQAGIQFQDYDDEDELYPEYPSHEELAHPHSYHSHLHNHSMMQAAVDDALQGHACCLLGRAHDGKEM